MMVLVVLLLSLVSAAALSAGMNDGRLNPHPGAPVAIYCHGTDAFEIFSIDANSGEGKSALYVDFDQIWDSDPDVTIVETPTINVSRAHNYAVQVRATQPDGKIYFFSWFDCPLTFGREFIIDPVTGEARRLGYVEP